MEEQTEDEVQEVESVEQEGEEEAVANLGFMEDVEEVGKISDNEDLMENAGIMLPTDDEGVSEFGEEDILDEMEDAGAMSEKEEGEVEFVKKKKPEPKVRRVDMDIYYPEESKSSLDERAVKKETVEVAAEGVTQEIDDSEELIDPNKDYSVVDPSFLNEFLSSEEERYSGTETFEAKKKAEAFEVEVEEEEDDFQQEIYLQPPEREPSDRVYDQICDLETPVSSDDSFKVPRFRYVPRRRSYPTQGFREEDNKWLSQTQSVPSMEVPSNALLNLMENLAPALKKTLIEIATYQPSNAIHYMTHSLLHKSKTPEEIGLEPDPHLIQIIVDGQRKKKKPLQIPIVKTSDEVFIAPYPESVVSTPHKEIKQDTPIQDDDDVDEDPTQLQKFQRKYRKAKKDIATEEKAKREDFDRKTLLPGTCLGPTSLPLIVDVAPKSKVGFKNP